MRTPPLPSSFHSANRKAFAQSIGEEAIAIIDTADKFTRRGDFEFPYRPDSNFYYLTGIDEPEAVLVLVPGHANRQSRELLFISGTTQQQSHWEGDRLTPEAAAKLSGVEAVLPLSDLTFYLNRLLAQYGTIYTNAEAGIGSVMPHPAVRRAQTLRQQAPAHRIMSALQLLDKQRTIKAPVEVERIREAANITLRAIANAQAAAQPGVHEYALEAELTAEFTRSGASAAWPPIVAAGAHTTVIHYAANTAKLTAGDMVLIDTGAEFGYYAADISRTFAVGEFSKRQQAVYDAVSRVQAAGIARHRPGESVMSIDEYMRSLLEDEIKALGLKEPLSTYYPHISHHLGLDIHDTGSARLKFEPGMVVTCEPGLYVRAEGIGVRLEDDILITETGHEVLSATAK